MAAAGTPLEQRHEATRHSARWLVPNPRLDGTAADVAQCIWQAAQSLLELLDDGIELTAGLRKLREAKDCFVIQALEDSGGPRLYAGTRLYVAREQLPLAETEKIMTALHERLHVTELGEQAKAAPPPPRVLVTLIAGFFYAIGWIIGGLWRGAAFCAVSARYGFWQGLGLTDEQIGARLAAKRAAQAPTVPQPAAGRA